MKQIDIYKYPITNKVELMKFYKSVIEYREFNKSQSEEIARYAFDRTHPEGQLDFTINEELIRIRFEFGALEAPGMPESDSEDPDEYSDKLWDRLYSIIEKVQ